MELSWLTFHAFCWYQWLLCGLTFISSFHNLWHHHYLQIPGASQSSCTMNSWDWAKTLHTQTQRNSLEDILKALRVNHHPWLSQSVIDRKPLRHERPFLLWVSTLPFSLLQLIFALSFLLLQNQMFFKAVQSLWFLLLHLIRVCYWLGLLSFFLKLADLVLRFKDRIVCCPCSTYCQKGSDALLQPYLFFAQEHVVLTIYLTPQGWNLTETLTCSLLAVLTLPLYFNSTLDLLLLTAPGQVYWYNLKLACCVQGLWQNHTAWTYLERHRKFLAT